VVDYTLSRHAEQVLAARRIAEEWVELTVRRPTRTEPDKEDPALEHRLRRIPAFGNRVLRVVVTQATPPRVVTAYFDRALRNDPAL
jgi:hypothetical protein